MHQEMWTKTVITRIGKNLYHGSLHDPMALKPGQCLAGKLQLRWGPGIAQRRGPQRPSPATPRLLKTHTGNQVKVAVGLELSIPQGYVSVSSSPELARLGKCLLCSRSCNVAPGDQWLANSFPTLGSGEAKGERWPWTTAKKTWVRALAWPPS